MVWLCFLSLLFLFCVAAEFFTLKKYELEFRLWMFCLFFSFLEGLNSTHFFFGRLGSSGLNLIVTYGPRELSSINCMEAEATRVF